jgi:hypothetical protein
MAQGKISLWDQLLYPNGIKPVGAQLDPYGNATNQPLDPIISTSQKQIAQQINEPLTVVANPPRHLQAPEGVQSLDMRRVLLLAPATVDQLVISFTCPQGANVFFTHYAIYTNALDASLVEFKPTVDGNRIVPYHGDPNNNFKLDLSVGPDLSATSLIQCQVTMAPGQVMTWTATNNTIGLSSMGVRMVGYFDFGGFLTNSKAGG